VLGLTAWLSGSAKAFQGNILEFYRDCERQGGLVATHIWRYPVYVVTDPALIEEVLVRKQGSFGKSSGLRVTLAAFGRGLLTSDGALWRQQRRILQPAFNRRRVDGYRRYMEAAMARVHAAWAEGGVRDVHRTMTDFCFDVLAHALFGEDMAEGRPFVVAAAEALHEFHQYFVARPVAATSGLVFAAFRRLSVALGHPGYMVDLSRLPTPPGRRFRRAVAALDAFAASLVERRRRASDLGGDDLLALLLAARGDRGQPLDAQQIRDEVVTMFFAGHETGASALTWAFYLLAQHPEIAARVAAADDSVFTEQVMRESLRLYPPAHRISRTVLAPCELGGVRLKLGAEVIMPQWAVHRSARHFEEPEAFRPDRWTSDMEARLPRFAYFPFGGGARTCIGNHFALHESHYVLTSILRAYELAVVPGVDVSAQLGVTMLPRGSSLPLVVRRRRLPVTVRAEARAPRTRPAPRE
jgi:cytochrome P450